MNEDDMRDRGLKKYDLVDMTSFAKDGASRHLSGFRAITYNLPRGCAMGYMPEHNVLCRIGDYSAQSHQRLMKHVVLKISPSKSRSSASLANHAVVTDTEPEVAIRRMLT